VARQLLVGLNHIHKSGVVHCDIKAENILINVHTFDIKIIDFGLCSDRSTVRKDETKNLLKGTYVYMSPEVLTGTGA